ncbi:hypothetical protein [Alteriqipengyuania sp. 357]
MRNEHEDFGQWPDDHKDDIIYGGRRLSRGDSSLSDWEMPDTAYRPVPIVWFTGAFFIHFIVGCLLLVIVPTKLPAISTALCGLLAAAVAKWTWDRGMSSAGTGWKAATLIMLSFNVFLMAVIAYSV